MDQQRLTRLLKKYKAGTCSQQELNELSAWYAQLDMPQEADRQDSEATGQEMLHEFKRRNQMLQPQVKRLRPLRYMRVAAALLAGVAFGVALLKYNTSNTANVVAVPIPIAGKLVKAAHNRFVQLPDGSRVILKAGSRLNYTNAFNVKQREVSLTGEAYFDVKHDAKRPFIIHTGAVSTRVLGTAFNIKAYADQPRITVTVTRGKVRVADKTHLLAILTPNKQVVFNKTTATAERLDTKAVEQIQWVKQNLSFDDEPLGSIIKQLAERYDTPIRFQSAGMNKCPITVSFSGAETIEEALNIICLTRNASFKKINGAYIIHGNGCPVNDK